MLSVAQAVHHPETPGSTSKPSALGHPWSSERPNVLKRRKTESDCFTTDKKIAVCPMESSHKCYTINHSEITLTAIPKNNGQPICKLSQDKMKTSFYKDKIHRIDVSGEIQEQNKESDSLISTNIPPVVISFIENSAEIQLTKLGSNKNIKLVNRNEVSNDHIILEKSEEELSNSTGKWNEIAKQKNNISDSTSIVDYPEVTIKPRSNFSKSKVTKLASSKATERMQSKIDRAKQELLKKREYPVNKLFNASNLNETFDNKVQIRIAESNENFDFYNKPECIESASTTNFNIDSYIGSDSLFVEEHDNCIPTSSICDYEPFNVGIACDKFYVNNRDKPHYTTGFPNPPSENRCWINATLQALFTLPIVNKLDTFDVPDCSKLMISLIGIQNLWRRGKTGSHHFEQIFNTFKEEISVLDKLYSSKAQQDVSEFVLNLLNFIKTEIETVLTKASHNNEIENIPNNEQDTFRKFKNNSYDSNKRLPLSDISRQLKNNALNSKINSFTENLKTDNQNEETLNPIDEYFSLYMVENYICDGCSKERQQKVENLMLFIDLPTEDQGFTVNLVDMINTTYALEHRNMTCESCKHDVHSMVSKFRKLPKILTIQVKRYEMTNSGTIMKKCTLLEVPKLLKLDSLIINNNQDFNQFPEYELIGIISHIGDNIDSGHYISFVKHENQWFYYDDMNVKLLSDDEVFKCIQNNAYVIFFQDTNIDQSIDI